MIEVVTDPVLALAGVTTFVLAVLLAIAHAEGG